MSSNKDIAFLQWALPKMGYRWEGFRKPRSQVLKRIRERMQHLELSGGYPEYKKYLLAHPDEWKQLDQLCDVTISKFYRDRKVWEYLRDDILADLFSKVAPGSISVWSAGCCNGEEAYSISMISEQLSVRNSNTNKIEILATDRNPEVLKRARIGRYPAGALKELTKQETETFFHKIDDSENDYQIGDRLKLRITFEKGDIRNSLPNQEFDLILCRNLVFTYFTKERQLHFLNRLISILSSDGCLVIGSNEDLPKTNNFELVSKSHRIYKCSKVSGNR